jgi:subtilase family serine protease
MEPIKNRRVVRAQAAKARTQNTATKPDLTVTGFRGNNEAPAVGDPVSFNVTVRNSGGTASGSFQVKVQDATGYRATREFASLKPGQSRTSLVGPLEARGHLWRLTVTADSSNRVRESNEGNNTKSKQLLPHQLKNLRSSQGESARE